MLTIMELKEILDKVQLSFNNSAEAWNKGLTVDYAIFTMKKNIIPYTNGRLQILLPKMRYAFHVS